VFVLVVGCWSLVVRAWSLRFVWVLCVGCVVSCILWLTMANRHDASPLLVLSTLFLCCSSDVQAYDAQLTTFHCRTRSKFCSFCDPSSFFVCLHRQRRVSEGGGSAITVRARSASASASYISSCTRQCRDTASALTPLRPVPAFAFGINNRRERGRGACRERHRGNKGEVTRTVRRERGPGRLGASRALARSVSRSEDGQARGTRGRRHDDTTTRRHDDTTTRHRTTRCETIEHSDSKRRVRVRRGRSRGPKPSAFLNPKPSSPDCLSLSSFRGSVWSAFETPPGRTTLGFDRRPNPRRQSSLDPGPGLWMSPKRCPEARHNKVQGATV
jgi:hypothetical protein